VSSVEAKQFLWELLSEGPISQKDVRKNAEEAGFGWRTVRRAKDALRVEARRDGGMAECGRWIWLLPDGPKMSSQEVGHLSNFGHLSGPKMSKVPKAAIPDVGHLSEHQLDDEFEEGAAIRECDGRLPQADAEVAAAEEFPELPDFLRR
jgi:hypothetical protein